MKPQRFGTHMHFNSEAAFPHARRSTARTGTLRTRTPWRGSTNCNRQKEKAHQLKGETLFFFSSKMERARAKECPTARAKECPTAMAKDSTAEAKAIAKAKSQKGNDPKVSEEPSFSLVISASSRRHYKVQSQKYAVLTPPKTGYGRIRAKLPNEKVYVY